jgi:hypothetical protein
MSYYLDVVATERTASRLAQAALGRKLTKHEKVVAGPNVHYAFGCASGALYGSAVELSPLSARDSVCHSPSCSGWRQTKPLCRPLGFRGRRLEHPISSHLSALSAHAVYGLTAELVRRALGSALSTRELPNATFLQ